MSEIRDLVYDTQYFTIHGRIVPFPGQQFAGSIITTLGVSSPFSTLCMRTTDTVVWELAAQISKSLVMSGGIAPDSK